MGDHQSILLETAGIQGALKFSLAQSEPPPTSKRIDSMASHIAASIGRALRRALASPAHDDVHFHLDTDGRAFVCDHHRCESPGLSVGEAVVLGR
jgi:hypothetical protein